MKTRQGSRQHRADSTRLVGFLKSVIGMPFTSPDEPLIDQHPGDPQSWNLCSYVRNNPLIFTDPTGKHCVYVNSGGTGIDSINNQNISKDCGWTGGYWVDGTVTNARFAHGSLILTGTTDGTNRTSASYGLGPDPGLMALEEAGNRASRDVSTSAIIMGGTTALIAAAYVVPLAYAALPAGSEAGALILGGKALQLVGEGKGQHPGGSRDRFENVAAAVEASGRRDPPEYPGQSGGNGTTWRRYRALSTVFGLPKNETSFGALKRNWAGTN